MLKARLSKPLAPRPRPDRKFDPAYQRERRRLLEDDDYRPQGLDDDLRLLLRQELLERRGIKVDLDMLRAAYAQSRQQLYAPQVTERTSALAAAFQQEEAQQLWDAWFPDRQVRPCDVGSFETKKAVLATTAALGVTYLKSGRDRLRSSRELLETFSKLASASPRGEHLRAPLLTIPEYSSLTKRLGDVSEDAPLHAQQMCVRVAQELARLFPQLPIGEHLAIDAQMVPAWTAQKSAKRGGEVDESLEAYYRRRCPDAGFRAYGYDRDGIGDPARRNIKITSAIRGYLQLLLVDITTGLPLVGLLADASKLFEPDGLRPLLTRLYGFWPDIPLRAVVGDKLYDTRDACLACELEFGVTPVFVRRGSHIERNVHLFRPDQHRTIAHIDGYGVAYCRAHGLPLRVESISRPDRTTLAAGEPAPDSELRLRFVCDAPNSCGRPTLRMSVDASSLTRLPHHHASGRPRELALRHALLAARNSVESAHGSLQLGYGQGGKDGSRARVYDRSTLETLHWLAYGSRALLMLLAHRQHHDEVAAWIELQDKRDAA